MTGNAWRKATLDALAGYFAPAASVDDNLNATIEELAAAPAASTEPSVSLEAFRAMLVEDGLVCKPAYNEWVAAALADPKNAGVVSVDEWIGKVLSLERDEADDDFAAQAKRWRAIMSAKRRTELLDAVFAKMDADQSKEVDLKEFAHIAEGTGLTASALGASALPELFQAFDTDQDGMLSLDEWVRGMLDRTAAVTDAQFEADADKWLRNLTDSQRRIWRSVHAHGHAKALLLAMRASGATHALFITHANATKPAAAAVSPPTAAPAPVAPAAAPASAGEADAAEAGAEAPAPTRLAPKGAVVPVPKLPLDPGLSQQGQAQSVVALSSWYGRLPVRKLLLTSPSASAKQTAQMMAGLVGATGGGEAEGKAATSLIEVQALLPHGVAPAAERIVRGAPSGGKGPPLRSMLDTEGGEGAFGGYAEAACKELAAALRAVSASENATPRQQPPTPHELLLKKDSARSPRSVVAEVAVRSARALKASLTPRGLSRPPARVLASPRGGTGGTYIAMFGHATFVNAVAHAVAAAAGTPSAGLESVLDVQMDEAEAILVPVYGGGAVMHLRRPV